MNIEFPQIVNDRGKVLLLVVLVQHDSMSLDPGILEVVLYEECEMRVRIDMVHGFKVEDIAIIP